MSSLPSEASPACTQSPEWTEICFPLGIRYSFGSPTSGVTTTFRLPLVSLPKLTSAINLRDDRKLFGLARFEKLGHAWEPAGDIFGFGGFTRNLGYNVSCVNFLTLFDHDIRAHGEKITASESPILMVLPCSSLMETRGRISVSLSLYSTMTFRDRPVTSSTCSFMVRPSMTSPNFTFPGHLSDNWNSIWVPLCQKCFTIHHVRRLRPSV